jgi:hypothetical protein
MEVKWIKCWLVYRTSPSNLLRLSIITYILFN